MSWQSCQSCTITIDSARYKGRFADKNRQTIIPNHIFHNLLYPPDLGLVVFMDSEKVQKFSLCHSLTCLIQQNLKGPTNSNQSATVSVYYLLLYLYSYYRGLDDSAGNDLRMRDD
jgi:hypothetical protein